MKKIDVVKKILETRINALPNNTVVETFAPSNIALCKYWGKRDPELNLPVTSSLSVSLGNKGTTTKLNISEQEHDIILLNDQPVSFVSSFGKRLTEFLDLFRTKNKLRFHIDIQTNIPIAAGLASSASGFASIVKALDQLFEWKLSNHELSILARLGSGSASRSITSGFVEWHQGVRTDGFDSFGELIPDQWPDLCVGLLILSDKEKLIGSREAMQRTITTSPLYSVWPSKVSHDLSIIKKAISVLDFHLLGKTAESNAMTMHATMLSAWPPISYAVPETLLAARKIWELRYEGFPLYFTQDAGPNLKLLFLEKDKEIIREHFPAVEIVRPFEP